MKFKSFIVLIRNTVTIIALIRCPKLRLHATTFFVLSLSISDLLFCLINLPLMADRYIHQEWRMGDALCKVFPVILYGNVALSLLNMVAITVNRYIIISYYEYYSKLYSKLSIWIQLFAIWSVAFLIMLPPSLGIWGELGLNKSTFSCTINKKDGKSPKQFIFLVGFVIPCLVIIVSYTCIYLKVRQSNNNLKSHRSNPKERSSKRERDDRRLTKLMLLIFACFLFCFLPLMCVNVFDDDTTIPTLHVCASILAWASSVVNPIIYVASNKQYRLAYAKLFNVVKSTITVSDSRQLSNSCPRTTRNATTHNLTQGYTKV
ncbi:protein trapped in endoderm-1-like isoform X2 [Onthophagus taurus]|uniref:protein trapped in endoderm-1-like isoform X2 n=1 Tax=Onthophagus taurus TaxID=166361 RepID=UPI000C2057DF|nr:protein trapped in endoderm-1-like isoform X2 [Onthophagus taurus]